MKYIYISFGILCCASSLRAQPVNNGSTIVVTSGTQVQVNGNLQNATGGTLQNNGTLNATGNVSNAGTVKGTGTIAAPAAVTNSGFFSPGNDNVGQLNITGDYNNGTGTLAIEIGGATAGTTFDQLAISGAVSATGILNVNIVNAYTAPPSTTFDIITATSVSGTFGTLNLPSGWTVNYLSNKIQVQSPAPLPVYFEYFTGMQQEGRSHLDWKVNPSTPGSLSLQLQRSRNARAFNSLYEISADATRCSSPFAYEDNQPLPGINYYRLMVTEAEGKVSYSNIITLNTRSDTQERIALSPNPIPAGGTAVIKFSTRQQGKMKIWITDATGRRMTEQNQTITAGMNSITLRGLSNLAAGRYQVSLQTEDGGMHSLSCIKQ